jgi:hypothetical protein
MAAGCSQATGNISVLDAERWSSPSLDLRAFCAEPSSRVLAIELLEGMVGVLEAESAESDDDVVVLHLAWLSSYVLDTVEALR